MEKEFVIGIVGGMGSYATLDFFNKVLDFFPAVKEWDRPRIIIDNRCTMPSRVLAYLYGQDREKLVNQLYESMKGLVSMGASHIVLACNTSHLFLEEVYSLDNSLRNYVVDIIDCCKEEIRKQYNTIGSVFLFATEGTIDSCIYQNRFNNIGISIVSPSKPQYTEMREMIEAVKQNCIDEQITNKFLATIQSCGCDAVILGCTEFPVIYALVKDRLENEKIKVYDPLNAVLKYLYKEYMGNKE